MVDLAFTPEQRMLVDGELVFADDGKTFDNINPATEEVLGQAADASAAEMRRAIATARRAFDESDWSTNRDLRKRVLGQLHEALAVEIEPIREELIAEAGIPRSITPWAHLEAPLREGLAYPARLIDEFEWERDLGVAESFGAKSRRSVWKVPVGVVGAITPWNCPFDIIIGKMGQILATGNTMVLKPAPDTPWSATRLGRLLVEKTDIPPGVVNIVTTSDHLVGEELTLSPEVDMISFTGSTATGRRIMEKGAATMKRLFLELGGKSALIVLDDADFASVVPSGAGVCMHAGQGCSLRTRMLLPRSRYDEGVELITEAFRNIAYGDPQDPANVMGPVISSRQRERVLGYLARGVEEGATLAVGGGKPAHLDRGWFVEPTLFVDADNSMTIAREEIFGPVLVVIPYEDDEDAIRIANDSPYGLSGAVASADVERATTVARRIRSGQMNINGAMCYGSEVPFGGFRSSGIGRQNGIEGFEQHLETRAIAWPA